tara:strand:- start:663 stop:1493 length:831 start_codon:yes stop_codon:yes gene_type:complete
MAKRHNKKRNTAFLYEALVRELTKCVIRKDETRKSRTLSILKEHFNKSTLLYKELQLYKDVASSEGLEKEYAEKFVNYLKMEHEKIDKQRLFEEKNTIISKINKALSKSIYSNFVPNYKDLATISQLFDEDVSVKERIVLENKIIQRLTSEQDEKKEMQPITKLAYTTFIKKYNSEYSNLLEEQKQLLNHYIVSFSDDSLSLSIYLNEEIGRLKSVVHSSLEMEEVKNDPRMLEATNEVLSAIEDFKKNPVNETMIKQILKIQNLAKEIQTDGDQR